MIIFSIQYIDTLKNTAMKLKKGLGFLKIVYEIYHRK